MTPLKAIRNKCLDCSDGPADVKNCWDKKCALYEMRMGAGKKGISTVKAIRQKCLWCCCDNPYEVRLCPSTDCPLHFFRFGKNPNIKGNVDNIRKYIWKK